MVFIKKKLLTVIILMICVFGIGCYVSLARNNQNKNSIRSVAINDSYIINFADDKILMGASHNVFIAKIIDQIGATNSIVGPETQFEVAIVSNIKGGLTGTVTVDQQGGYDKNGIFYYIEGGVPMLQVGATYLLATRYNPTEHWYTLNSFPTASKLLSTNDSLSTEQLQSIAASDPRVVQLQAAYPHEILLTADIAHNNTLNSYVSAHPAQPLQNSNPTSTSGNSNNEFSNSLPPHAD